MMNALFNCRRTLTSASNYECNNIQHYLSVAMSAVWSLFYLFALPAYIHIVIQVNHYTHFEPSGKQDAGSSSDFCSGHDVVLQQRTKKKHMPGFRFFQRRLVLPKESFLMRMRPFYCDFEPDFHWSAPSVLLCSVYSLCFF